MVDVEPTSVTPAGLPPEEHRRLANLRAAVDQAEAEASRARDAFEAGLVDIWRRTGCSMTALGRAAGGISRSRAHQIVTKYRQRSA